MGSRPVALLLAALAGCGGGAEPPLAGPEGPRFAGLAEETAGLIQIDEGRCKAGRPAVQLRDEVVAAVNAGKVPVEHQERLLAEANALAVETADCNATEETAERADDLADWLRGNA